MHYSLLSRFEGGWVGSEIVEHCPEIFGQDDSGLSISGSYSLTKKIKFCVLKHLITGNSLDYLKHLRESDGVRDEFAPPGEGMTEAEVAVMSLPLILYWHDQPDLLEQALRGLAQDYLRESGTVDEVLLWGQSMAIALQGTNPRQALEQLHPWVVGHCPHLTPSLKALKTALNRDEPWILSNLHNQELNAPARPIWMALYNWAATPEDLATSLQRALYPEPTPHCTLQLTGALSGVYNSMINLPIPWRLSRDLSPLLKPVEALFAAWSGVYSLWAIPDLSQEAIAPSPNLQRRPQLSIISQRR
ncbi:hypothetical protein K4A83_21205 [Spirulina subsalsa FACHB-351]|uniref:Uncharacterized protein n=1 Tax=Spirulina subsalsa FACHB-351 TaxID=234711 RepID=A0ABT3LB78_9CYAN|nr:hypothetical protein [Spirulina subsalsa]MCW6038767.1 hypothetical protein [Spirulina subsalsa FACHB-351]